MGEKIIFSTILLEMPTGCVLSAYLNITVYFGQKKILHSGDFRIRKDDVKTRRHETSKKVAQKKLNIWLFLY